MQPRPAALIPARTARSMGGIRLSRGLPLLALLVAPLAVASSNQDDLEYREPEFEEEDKRLQVNGSFESQWHEFDNLDFRPVDESSDQAILDSDDRNALVFSGVGLNLSYQVDDRTRLLLGASHRGMWGNDQIGNVNQFGGFIYLTALGIEHTTDSGLELFVGREFFSIGGIPRQNEYALADIVDQVRLDVPLGEAGRLVLIPANVVGSSANPDDVNFVSYIGQNTTQSFGFRGDHMTRRHGAMLVLDEVADGLDARAYAFYTDIGALGSGSDITYNGRLGNFSDNDWVANAGLRGSFEAGAFTPWASVDLSTGIDRKELVAGDVDTTGYAVAAGLAVDTTDDDADDQVGFRGGASFYRALGPAYLQNGMQTSHGYVGMKARQAGGTLANRFLGWHPSAYVGMFGVSDDVHSTSRKSGTQVLEARVGYALPGKLEVGAAWWMFTDTGVTGIRNFDRVHEIDPPFGYSREEFFAQQRLGQTLGQEIDVDVTYALSDKIAIHLNGATLLPGRFYDIEIARVAGTALGGQAPAWAVNGGTRLRF